ncbi:DUF541 domain-containing protein [Candidatus Microgenomates bacterium]|nr:MAG: DUF541 domain-containing protein [Candidatus Microgenomates bacterium]
MIRTALFAATWFVLLLVFFVVAAVLFLPLNTVNWGTLHMAPAAVITVIGEADSQVTNQVATYTAGVSTINDNKDVAIAEVGQKVITLVEAVKASGIPASDIQTQNVSVYQQEEQYYEDGRQKSRPGQWRVSNNIDITLRNVEQAEQLTALLVQNGATNIYGPNFRLDDTKTVETELLELAIKNAQEKALKIAQSSDKTLGALISVTEGGAGQQAIPFVARDGMGGGGGGAVEPGTGSVSKTVTVTFEFK